MNLHVHAQQKDNFLGGKLHMLHTHTNPPPKKKKKKALKFYSLLKVNVQYIKILISEIYKAPVTDIDNE